MKKGKFFKSEDKTTKQKIKHNDLKKVIEILNNTDSDKTLKNLRAPNLKTVLNFHRNH
jgi:hypothetical protein